MDELIKQVEVMKVNVRPGDILIFKIKSDTIESSWLQFFSDHLRAEVFPDNKCLVIGLDPQDDLEVTAVGPEEQEEECCGSCECGPETETKEQND